MEYFEIKIHLVGVKRGCRKKTGHLLNAGSIPYNGGVFNQDEVEIMAKNLIKTNMRSVDGRVIIHLDHVIHEGNTNLWMPFSDKNKKFELVTSLENALK